LLAANKAFAGKLEIIDLRTLNQPYEPPQTGLCKLIELIAGICTVALEY
jgi:hypothetical protein